MASNFDVDQVVDKIASINPQTIGDFGAQMLPVPREYQVETSYVISYAAYRLLTDVFEVAAGTGFSFNAMSLTLKQIQKQIEELAKKVDKLLMADMKTAKDRIWHGMNYLQEEKKQFVPLIKLSAAQKRVIADSVFHDVETVIQQ